MEMTKDSDLYRNGSGIKDPTAYEALKNIEKEEFDKKRFNKLMKTIFTVCELAGFELKGRINVVDKWTGKEWK